MRILSISVVAAGMAASSVSAEIISEYTSMSNYEQTLFSKVASYCADDVDRLCKHDEEDAEKKQPSLIGRRVEGNTMNNMFPFPLPMTTSSSSLFFEDFHRQALEEFDSFVNHFILRPPTTDWVVVFDTRGVTNNKPPCHLRATANNALMTKPVVSQEHEYSSDASSDELLRHIAVHVDPSEDEHVTERLQRHGNALLNTEGLALTETGRRMARRLQAVSSDEIKTIRQSFLPFGEHSQCLEQMFHQPSSTVLSSNCFHSLNALHAFRSTEYIRKSEERKDEMELYLHISVLYFFGFCTLFVFAWRRRKQIKRDMRLQQRILTAIYSNPGLKRAVEIKIGESAGLVPPLPPHVLASRGYYGAEFRRYVREMRLVRLAILLLLSYGFMCALLFTVKVVASFSMFHCLFVTFSPKPRDPVCTCCCCGMSTEDLKNGTVTDAQACCGCCQGTGVCSVQCASCCDPKLSDPPCTCCCCGMSTEDLKNGTVTDAQACCGCCKGTGVCSVECASCCGKDSGCCCCGSGCCGTDGCCCGGTSKPSSKDGDGCCCGSGCCGADGCCGKGCCGADGCCGKGCCGADGCCGKGCCGADGCCAKESIDTPKKVVYEDLPTVQIV